MDITKLAVADTAFLHLRDANDELLYEDVGGKSEPVGITLYSPGTKQFARAQAAKQNRFMDRAKKRGKSDLTAEETIEENATFLTSCTESMQNIAMGELTGAALFKAVYANTATGFIADQAMKFMADWSNFKNGSTAS